MQLPFQGLLAPIVLPRIYACKHSTRCFFQAFVSFLTLAIDPNHKRRGMLAKIPMGKGFCSRSCVGGSNMPIAHQLVFVGNQPF